MECHSIVTPPPQTTTALRRRRAPLSSLSYLTTAVPEEVVAARRTAMVWPADSTARLADDSHVHACAAGTLWRATGNQIGREARALMNAGLDYSTFWAPVINLAREPRVRSSTSCHPEPAQKNTKKKQNTPIFLLATPWCCFLAVRKRALPTTTCRPRGAPVG